ncbi:hypothetical protein NDU88_008280 [Pleurodeles waltl]|uniref:Uncharacterized protein n=1 Tax=Pleurodeles waltl TaxID=8319 RepID=A0AAV7NVM8_PLEWA|nr:hypothetical protein NDU88_008280 [Pleurodeles waltl]
MDQMVKRVIGVISMEIEITERRLSLDTRTASLQQCPLPESIDPAPGPSERNLSVLSTAAEQTSSATNLAPLSNISPLETQDKAIPKAISEATTGLFNWVPTYVTNDPIVTLSSDEGLAEYQQKTKRSRKTLGSKPQKPGPEVTSTTGKCGKGAVPQPSWLAQLVEEIVDKMKGILNMDLTTVFERLAAIEQMQRYS